MPASQPQPDRKIGELDRDENGSWEHLPEPKVLVEDEDMPSTPSPPLKRVSQPQRMDSKLDNIPKSIPLRKRTVSKPFPKRKPRNEDDDLGDGSHYSMEEFKQDATKWLKAMSLFIGVFAVYFGRFLMTPALNTDLKKGGLGPMVSIGEERVKWLNARNKGLDDFLVKDPLRIFLIWTTPPETFTVRNFKVIDAYFYHHPDAQIDIIANHLEPSLFAAYVEAGYNLNVIRSNDTFLTNLASNGCPGSDWVASPLWKMGRYYYSHVTDYIRFCALYTHGGVYSDFDALTLNRMDGFGGTFIGRDSSGAKKPLKLGQAEYTIMTAEQIRKMPVCDFCLRDGDTYLAPGVMGAIKGHRLVYEALRIGFGEGNYDPNVFNAVGPQAVTKAYKAMGGDVNDDVGVGITVLDKGVLYPFNYLTSWEVFEAEEDGEVKMEGLVRKATSLHLYGHKTKNIVVGPGSVVEHVMRKYSVIKVDERMVGQFGGGKVWHDLKGPRFVGVRRFVEEVKDVRILARRGAGLVGVVVSVKNGTIRLVDSKEKAWTVEESWTKKLVFELDTPAAINRRLSRLVYSSEELTDGRDIIEVRMFDVNSREPEDAPVLRIPVYDVNKLVTIMAKTMDRIGKIFLLVESARRQYPNITIIASDDGGNLPPGGEGPKRGFYFLPLPYDVGLSAGRNLMVERIKTEYVLTLDDDFTLGTDSSIADLVHALETPDAAGKTFDIAAAKNPDDEDRFELDFCGIMTITPNRVLSLAPGRHGKHANCYHVDFVPNIFVARTSLLRDRLKWDELLKLGEHEDFFLRAKNMGVRTLTCPGVSFHHNQVQHWLLKTEYDRKRNRVYDFWRLSLRKHNLIKLVSFGRTMMDLIIPPPIDTLGSTEILSRSVTLTWKSTALSFKVLMSTNKGYSWAPVNYGQGENYQPVPIIASTELEGQKRERDDINKIVVFGLLPGTQYSFRVHAGNRFDYEERGVEISVRTLSSKKEQDINLLQNPSFESGLEAYSVSKGSEHRVVSPGLSGDYAAEVDITTMGYLKRNPTVATMTQTIRGSSIHPSLSKIKRERKARGNTLTLSMHSRLGKFFDQYPSWRMEFSVWFEPGHLSRRRMCENDALLPPALVRKPDVFMSEEFDRSNGEWQSRVATVCFGDEVAVAQVVATGTIESFRGFVKWDGWVLAPGVGFE